ncbi:armadillo repeat-containing protein 7 isoform X1 [Nomascus leucogenys]|uniref:armadillo repeat-containing protein 7 isoform X1 n=1 Tax=Nomascus leucogenys TaxID=61853 RepID=UPI00122D8ECA|nr:armadillo repeat-containing protein 7 isoform X1 [Nomascus leucogenys]
MWLNLHQGAIELLQMKLLTLEKNWRKSQSSPHKKCLPSGVFPAGVSSGSGSNFPRTGTLRRPVQPVPRQGQQGAHPAGRRRPTHHQLPVQPQRGDGAVRHHHAHAPEPAGPQLSPRADRHARGAVHASLLPLCQRQAPEPGTDFPGGLLFPPPGGRGPRPAGALCPGYPTAEERGPAAALIHGDRETAAPLLLETTVLMWTQGTGGAHAAPLVPFQPFERRFFQQDRHLHCDETPLGVRKPDSGDTRRRSNWSCFHRLALSTLRLVPPPPGSGPGIRSGQVPGPRGFAGQCSQELGLRLRRAAFAAGNQGLSLNRSVWSSFQG